MTRTRTRTVVGIGLAIATLTLFLVTPTPAGAGVTALDVSAECDVDTGDYDVVFTIVNGSGSDAPINVLDYEVDGVDQADPVFSPNPLPGFGVSEASDVVPGTTTSVYIEVEIQYAAAPAFLEAEQTLDGDCEPPATTTVPNLLPTTTTEAPAAQAVARQPTFTG